MEKKEQEKKLVDDGELLFNYADIKKSERVVEADEVMELIASSKGVSRKALILLTGNLLRTDLINLQKNKKVKVKNCSEISINKPQKVFYTTKKMDIKSVQIMELLGYGIWYFRSINGMLQKNTAKVGKVSIREDYSAIATAVVGDDDYVLMELIAVNLRDYKRKLSTPKNESLQRVIIVDSRELLKIITKEYDLTNCIIVSVQNKKYIKGIYISQSNAVVIDDSFDFTQLVTHKGNREVERVLDSYKKLDRLRQKNAFKK